MQQHGAPSEDVTARDDSIGRTEGQAAAQGHMVPGPGATEIALMDAPIVGYSVCAEEQQLYMLQYPCRPGRTACEFFSKTGYCKFGDTCIFDHPPELAVQLTEQGLPYRPTEPICSFYLKNNCCKYGGSCKFHHPKLLPIFAGSEVNGFGG